MGIEMMPVENPVLSALESAISALEAQIAAEAARAAKTSITLPASLTDTAGAFVPLLAKARYKAAHGGRGSGKSHFFVSLAIRRCLERPTSIVFIREVQRVLSQSSKRLVETMIQKHGLGQHFEVLHDRIKTPGGGLMIFQGMQDHTAESIKSLEGYDIASVDEAQALSARSLQLLRPTIRKPGSEIWFGWNPRHKRDAVDEFFRAHQHDEDAVIVEANWRDNPWFPAVLEDERKKDLQLYPERYGHIWEGEYAKAFEGAYFSKELLQARQLGRICRVQPEPTHAIRSFWDLGGAGAKADAMAIWIVQFVGREIRVLDYLEGVGQVLGFYIHELRRRGWGAAQCVLPHDGATTNWASGKRWSDHLSDAGFEVEVIKNQGAGAAMLEIEAIRRILPRCWFNEATTEAGREALASYHERLDENRKVGLGPEHDWSSHAARAFGAMAISYEEPRLKIRDERGGENRHSPSATHWSA
jgi:phage terminase large subunit